MQTVIPGEDGRQRALRGKQELDATNTIIQRRANEDVISEAQQFALAQIANKNFKRGLDYEGIIKYRAVEPGYFNLLPSDAECRKALKAK